jgi:multisubunit Na+/H+ antiporter MnhC subunit
MFSTRKSLKTLAKGQLCFLIMTFILLTNVSYWRDPFVSWILIFMFVQPGVFLLAFVDGFRTKKTVEIEPRERENVFSFKGFLKSLWFLTPVLIFMTLTMGHFDRDAVVPFPSALILGFLLVNGFFNFLSLFVPSYVVLFYVANVYDEGKTAWSEGFRYTMLYFWSLNAEIQNLLSRFPFYIQRPVTLLLCIWYIFTFGAIASLFGW